MSNNLKALIVVLIIAAITFRLAEPIVKRFMIESDFRRRRNVWLVLTTVAFLSPNFWAYALVAAPLFIWSYRRDTNPVGLYLIMLHVVPPVAVEATLPGINDLFAIGNYRLLSFCVLIPTWFMYLRRTRTAQANYGLQAMDFFLLAYGALQVYLYIPPDLPNHVILEDSFTNHLRVAFLFFIDVFVLYFVVSRTCSTHAKILDVLAAYCMSAAIMSFTAAFEVTRHWMLYADLTNLWSDAPQALNAYLLRGDILRAQSSSGGPLVLGYLVAIAFGFWLYLQSYVKSRLWRYAATLLFWLGMFFAYSRGPWIGAALIYFVFVALAPHRFINLLKAAFAVTIIAALIALSPIRSRVVNVLPFFGGSIDSYNVAYRQRLVTRSWELIKESPFLGDQRFYSKMEDLRQGLGIIDLVNTYSSIALLFGFVGLCLFIGFALVGLYKAHAATTFFMKADRDLAVLGVCIVSCILGTLLMIENCSLILGYEKMYYILGALASAYARLGHDSRQSVPNYANSNLQTQN